jgi:hypothetical protein
MHAFRSGKPWFHVSMQNDLFIQIKLNFWVTS